MFKLIHTYTPTVNLSKTYKGVTPLCRAIKNNELEISKLLILLGAPLNQLSRTPAHIVAGKIQFQNETPLTLAISLKSIQMVELLLELGANPATPNGAGLHPLLIATIKEDFNLTAVLLKNGAPILFSNYYEHPLYLRCHFLHHKVKICGFKDLFDIDIEDHTTFRLQNNHIHTTNTTPDNLTRRLLLIELICSGLDIAITGTETRNPLLWSIKYADWGITYLLIEAGAKTQSKHPWLCPTNYPIQWQQDKRIRNYITHEIKNPPTLQRITNTRVRNIIRQRTNKDIRLTTKHLKLPIRLKNNLQLLQQSKVAKSLEPSVPWSIIDIPLNNWTRPPGYTLPFPTNTNSPPCYYPTDHEICRSEPYIISYLSEHSLKHNTGKYFISYT